MQADAFIEQSKPFLAWVSDWQAQLKPLSLAAVVAQDGAESVGIV